MHRRVVAVVAGIVIAGLVLSGCGSDDTGGTVAEGPDTVAEGPDTVAEGPDTAVKRIEVKAENIAFDPTAISLTAGEDVQFVITNGDEVKHSLTVEGLDVNQDVEGGKTAEAPVTSGLKAGTYPYICVYHPQMKGTITVT